MEGKWTLRGEDAFGDEPYPLPGEYDNEAGARAAANRRMEELEQTQPSEDSGGQDVGGIQDQVFVVRPDGTEYRFTV